MKDKTIHKKLVANRLATKRCNEAMFQELRRRLALFRAASQERRDGMLCDLQRCNFKVRI